MRERRRYLFDRRRAETRTETTRTVIKRPVRTTRVGRRRDIFFGPSTGTSDSQHRARSSVTATTTTDPSGGEEEEE
eukprot:975138-Rhodomonas_salina.1